MPATLNQNRDNADGIRKWPVQVLRQQVPMKAWIREARKSPATALLVALDILSWGVLKSLLLYPRVNS